MIANNKNLNKSEKDKMQKKLYQIDRNTFIDIDKVIGVEINPYKYDIETRYRVIIGMRIEKNIEDKGFNSSLVGVVPHFDFHSYEEALNYCRDIGIELLADPELDKEEYQEHVKVNKFGF